MKRNITFDIARAICILWIIGFWHMNGMLAPDSKFFEVGTQVQNICSIITNGTLACFTFISGYFLSKGKIVKGSDIAMFYKKRLLRFGLPLLSTCILLYVGGWLISWGQLLTTLLGVAQFTSQPYPRTVWFFSMMIFFYTWTPFFLYCNNRLRRRYTVFIAFLLYVICLLYHVYIVNVDNRLLLFYWFYTMPFLIDKKTAAGLVHRYKNLFFILLILVSAICLYFDTVFMDFYLSILCVLIIMTISKLLSKVLILNRLFEMIAYASMFAYLFHREIFVVFKRAFHDEGISLLIVPIVVIVVFVVSYYGQLIYDIIVDKYIIKK